MKQLQIQRQDSFVKRETLKQSGYAYHYFDAVRGLHILRDKQSNRLEAWVANKNHASYGIIYKNTHLEFAHSFQF